MSECRTRIAAACVFWLAGVAPGLAQTPGFTQTIEPAETTHFWALLLPNAAVALLGLGWVVLMARRRS